MTKFWTLTIWKVK